MSGCVAESGRGREREAGGDANKKSDGERRREEELNECFHCTNGRGGGRCGSRKKLKAMHIPVFPSNIPKKSPWSLKPQQ